MDTSRARSFIEHAWRGDVLPALRDYVRIPCQSPLFDPDWDRHGHVEAAVQLARAWVEARRLRGARVEVLRLHGRTPLLLLEVEGRRPGTVLLYGHLDKQPPFEGWREGLGPWTPVDRDDRLYGRGAADDGYAVFAATTAIQALQEQDVAHPRLVALVECSEESGSPDLPAHVDAAAPRIGSPDLVVALDSGCGDYRRLWLTTSLRGMIGGTLRVEVLREGVHSGDASGVVPSSFRILRQLLDRVEDAATGRILLQDLHVDIPAERREEARHAAEVLGPGAFARFPWVPGVRPMDGDLATLVLSRTWRPTLSVTGQAGMPPVETAGNVLRPFTAVKLSVRIPPTASAPRALDALKRAIEADPPGGARVTFDGGASPGWHAPPLQPWLRDAVDAASRAAFGEASCAMGEGGSIPFMAMLGERFPRTQFVITGVLGPEANAHGPNEFLHAPTAMRVTQCVADIVARMP
jgi:acetylornithine deacetylase/succinyl-diaminopimelate desuccinylase-like protein